MNNKDVIFKLLKKNEAGTVKPRQRQLLESWYNTQANTAETPEPVDYEHFKERIWRGINRKRLLKKGYNIVKIAAIIGLVAILILQSRLYDGLLVKEKERTAVIEVPPAIERATLTLPDGSKVDLNSIKPGSKISQHGVSVGRTMTGELVYDLHSAGLSGKHTVSTPRGGYFQLELPDGSHVWLNAATRLSYEVAPEKKERHVELDGEAYFEVKHDAQRPFIVQYGKQQVKVLGTHFNVSAYIDEEEQTTTLYEGSVEIQKGKITKRIVPGEQAMTSKGPEINLKTTDDKNGPSWKNGRISFDAESLESILRQASRWYDVDVVYESTPPQEAYTGGISRKSNLSALLKVLETNGVQYELKVNGKLKTLYIK